MRSNGIYSFCPPSCGYAGPLSPSSFNINVGVWCSCIQLEPSLWIDGCLLVWAPGLFWHRGLYDGILVTRNILSPWVGIPLGGVGAALMSLIISWPTFRLKGPYVAIVTLAFAEVLRITCANWVDLTRGQLGLSVPALFSGTSRIESYYFIFLIFSATWIILSKLMKSSWDWR